MCPDARTLSAYFDGEITENRREEMDRHIAECPACRATLREFEAQRRYLRSAAAPGLPGDADLDHFWSYVGRSRLHRVRGPRRISVPLPLAAAAVLALVVVSVLNFLPLGRGGMPDVVVVDSRPQAPTVVSFTVTPADLDDFFAMLEGEGAGDDAIHTLPEELPVARFGEPLMVRPASLEGAP